MKPPGLKRNDEIHRMLREMCGPRQDACEWLVSLIDLSGLWDDIVDQDKKVDPEHASCVFSAIAIGWGWNRFFRDHGETLSAVCLNAVCSWRVSDLSPHLRCKAFDLVTEVGTTVALLVGGPEHAAEWSPKLRRWALQKQMENDAKGT